ncbi:MAG: hypothetical protein SFY95_02610 [Planctomycetota bacterium]|nr:hypothetical protein [Planctomycetota bacterium]
MIRRGISIIEAVVSVAIVGGLAIAVINTVGSIGRARASAGERALAQLLASDLLSEILARRYCEDLAAKTVTLGPEAGETTAGTRAAFDDVDDYLNLTDPSVSGGVPRTREGLETPGVGKGWVRRVSIERVSPADLAASLTDQGLLRVTVTVERDGRVVAQLSGVRSRLAEESPR